MTGTVHSRLTLEYLRFGQGLDGGLGKERGLGKEVWSCWRRFGKGLEEVWGRFWARFGEGLEVVWWRRGRFGHGGGLGRVWGRFGEGLEEVWNDQYTCL